MTKTAGEASCLGAYCADADVLHAVRNALVHVELDEDLAALIPPAHDGGLLEIGVLDLNGDDPVAIHAMTMRPKFQRLLKRGR